MLGDASSGGKVKRGPRQSHCGSRREDQDVHGIGMEKGEQQEFSAVRSLYMTEQKEGKLFASYRERSEVGANFLPGFVYKQACLAPNLRLASGSTAEPVGRGITNQVAETSCDVGTPQNR